MDSIIPDYSEAKGELERDRETERLEIVRLCRESGKETDIPDDLKQAMGGRIKAFLDSGTLSPEMQEAAHDIVWQYADALFLKMQLSNASPPDEERNLPYMPALDKRVAKAPEEEVIGYAFNNRQRLANILINHVTWEALSRMRSYTGDDTRALAAVGEIIKNITKIYKETSLAKGVHVNPQFTGNTTQMIESIRDWGHQQRELLKECYKEALAVQPRQR